MTWSDSNFINLIDLYLAYRKAKVDMFYERDHATASAFARYENNLAQNLQTLLDQLTAPNPDWMKNRTFVGSYAYAPKSIGPMPDSAINEKSKSQFVSSDPDESWVKQTERLKPKVVFRIVGRHPVAFHIVSALWIQKVGHKYDALLSDHAYGSRLRRRPATLEGRHPASATSLGNFRPYVYGFRKWRSNGLKAMESSLDKGQPIVAITADLRSFYHEVDAGYLLADTFLEETRLALSSDERAFTAHLIEAIRTWAASTPEHKDLPNRGLPVGLSASRLIANVALWAFDRFIIQNMAPIYYGRYVDDVFLVLDNQRKMKSSAEVWGYLVECSKGLLVRRDENGEDAYQIVDSSLRNSNLRFVGEKQKVFSLRGQSGKALLVSISRTIRERSSDWRMLPDLPDDPEQLVTDFTSAGRDPTEHVDNLRKADGISIQRLAFALRLRNLEAVQKDLAPSQWIEHRDQFYSLVIDHVLTVPGLFAYGFYIPRVIGLAVACGDWNSAIKLIRRLSQIFKLLSDTTEVDETKLASCQENLLRAVFEAAAKSLIPSLAVPDTILDRLLNALGEASAFSETFLPSTPLLVDDWERPRLPDELRQMAHNLYISDLSLSPYRDRWLDEDAPPADDGSERVIGLPPDVSVRLRLYDAEEFLRTAGIVPPTLSRALVFPTRPLTPAEIVLLDQQCLEDLPRFKRWVRAIRGIELQLDDHGPEGPSHTKGSRDFFDIPNGQCPLDVSIAIPCFHTSHGSWTASVVQGIDPDNSRYFRLTRLINDVLRAKTKIQYVVLPEVSLPRRWFNRFSHKLTYSGISLIAGLEYLHWNPAQSIAAAHQAIPGNFVSNQVRASLVTTILGYRAHMIYVQEKSRPALQEGRDLQTVAGKSLLPIKQPALKHIIRHGQLQFGILICSELTNLDYRQPLRGKIDVLFIPEWNRDTESFSSLVEASALDIHCFIVQVNNREYGDCRVRAPYRDNYRRDVARVKGGEEDYFVIATIEARALRAFQSHHLSPASGKFKPVPDGFAISNSRRTRPE